MHIVVNDKYRYMMFYSAKAGCTSLRTLFLALHKEELSDQNRDRLRSYHNLNEVFPYRMEDDYSDYYKFYISRNPYGRAVSAFIDQYTLAQNHGVQQMLQKHPPVGEQPKNFETFLRYLQKVPDAERDSHFQTQSYFAYPKQIAQKRNRFHRSKNLTLLDYSGDISGFDQHMRTVYRRIFKGDGEMLARAESEISRIEKMNSVYYGDDEVGDAAQLSTEELRQVMAPKPQDFFQSADVQALVQEIYADDFKMFNYDIERIPKKKASPELRYLPSGFGWQEYLLLNPDLEPQGIDTRPKAVRHYIDCGRIEKKRRFYKVEAPDGFEWQRYINLHADLKAAGIGNERDALIHYLSFGYHEKRKI